MWTSGTWETEEDFEKDIILLSEHNQHLSENISYQVPETILNYRKQMALNKQKPLNSDIDDTVLYVVSGRGKGIRDRVLRPGGKIESHPMDDDEIKKKIRQVSGLGYSNKLIEEAIENGKAANKKSDDDTIFKMVSIGRNGNGNGKENKTTKNGK